MNKDKDFTLINTDFMLVNPTPIGIPINRAIAPNRAIVPYVAPNRSIVPYLDHNEIKPHRWIDRLLGTSIIEKLTGLIGQILPKCWKRYNNNQLIKTINLNNLLKARSEILSYEFTNKQINYLDTVRYGVLLKTILASLIEQTKEWEVIKSTKPYFYTIRFNEKVIEAIHVKPKYLHMFDYKGQLLKNLLNKLLAKLDLIDYLSLLGSSIVKFAYSNKQTI